jgi:hypothetical protein
VEEFWIYRTFQDIPRVGFGRILAQSLTEFKGELQCIKYNEAVGIFTDIIPFLQEEDI